MGERLTRRSVVAGITAASGLALSGCVSVNQPVVFPRFRMPWEPEIDRRPEADLAEDTDARSIYAALPRERFPIPAIKPGEIPERFHRRRVAYRGKERPGTIVIDTSRFFLHFVEPGGTAMRYGVGLGRQGFEWSGRGDIRRKAEWPRWHPPEEMIDRQPELEKYRTTYNPATREWEGGMDPGLMNPLGARALYIYQGEVDTLYRIHGTPEHKTIGRAVSSGCVRMVNHDVIDLYGRVPVGAPILVTGSAAV